MNVSEKHSDILDFIKAPLASSFVDDVFPNDKKDQCSVSRKITGLAKELAHEFGAEGNITALFTSEVLTSCRTYEEQQSFITSCLANDAAKSEDKERYRRVALGHGSEKDRAMVEAGVDTIIMEMEKGESFVIPKCNQTFIFIAPPSKDNTTELYFGSVLHYTFHETMHSVEGAALKHIKGWTKGSPKKIESVVAKESDLLPSKEVLNEIANLQKQEFLADVFSAIMCASCDRADLARQIYPYRASASLGALECEKKSLATGESVSQSSLCIDVAYGNLVGLKKTLNLLENVKAGAWDSVERELKSLFGDGYQFGRQQVANDTASTLLQTLRKDGIKGLKEKQAAQLAVAITEKYSMTHDEILGSYCQRLCHLGENDFSRFSSEQVDYAVKYEQHYVEAMKEAAAIIQAKKSVDCPPLLAEQQRYASPKRPSCRVSAPNLSC